MKKIISVLMCLCLILSTFTFVGITASADTEGYYTYMVSSDGEATITHCDTSISGIVAIPAALGGYPVTSIDDSAFYYCRSLTNVTIPDSVTSIGNYAFDYCTSLINVTIPDSVTSIGEGAFSDCTSLTSVTIPNTVTSIGDDAFNYCTSLTNVTIPDSVTSIGNDAFYDCDSLEKVNITDIKSWCEIKFAEHYSNPLYYANNLYLNGKLVTNLVIPNTVTSINDYAFYNCDSLTSVTIPNSVTSIGDRAFDNCTLLKSITIGKGVKSIGSDAFYNCNSLKKVNITDIKSWCEIDNPGILEDERILYLNGKLLKGDLVIPNGTKSIGDYAFYDCESLKSVTIPNSVTSIGCSAFSSCDSLKSVTIPNSVTSIGDYAFSWCENVESVIIPDSVTSIGDYAFSDCRSLRSVTIGKGLKSIGGNAFGHSYIESVTISDSISVDISNLLNWDRVEELIIKKGSKKVTASMCLGENVSKVVIPDTVKTIEKDVFYKCKNLKSICIPSSVTKIGEHAVGFYDNEETFDEYDLIKGFIIYGEKGSAAETYAKKNKIKFVNGHAPIWVISKSATHFVAGEQANKCVNCGEILSKKAIAKLTYTAPSITGGKKKITVKYKAVSGATGFEVRYKIKGSWKTAKYTTKKAKTIAIKKLKKGKYQVQVRAVKGALKTNWSKVKKITVK